MTVSTGESTYTMGVREPHEGFGGERAVERLALEGGGDLGVNPVDLLARRPTGDPGELGARGLAA